MKSCRCAPAITSIWGKKLAAKDCALLDEFSQTSDETLTGSVVTSHFTHPGGPCFHFGNTACDALA